MANSCSVCRQPLDPATTVKITAAGKSVAFVHAEPCARIIGDGSAALGKLAAKSARGLLASKYPKVLAALDFIAKARKSLDLGEELPK